MSMIATIDSHRCTIMGMTTTSPPTPAGLTAEVAATCAGWFATLSDPTRVRLLHTVAATPTSTIRVGELAEQLGISQSTCSHHVRKLAECGFLLIDKIGTSSVVSVNQACCTGLPHAADVVMGTLREVPSGPEDLPDDVAVRATEEQDMAAVLDIYGEGIASRNATFETRLPTARTLQRCWLPGHAWVAERGGTVVGWTALNPVSDRPCYAGVAESTVYVAESARGTGVGKSLLWRQVNEADTAGLWTCRPPSFPRTAPASPCTTPSTTAPSPYAAASPNSTASGATPSSSNAAAKSTDRQTRGCVPHRRPFNTAATQPVNLATDGPWLPAASGQRAAPAPCSHTVVARSHQALDGSRWTPVHSTTSRSTRSGFRAASRIPVMHRWDSLTMDDSMGGRSARRAGTPSLPSPAGRLIGVQHDVVEPQPTEVPTGWPCQHR